ncbi:hypothetical protein CMO88_04660 [Candidatus Woesearchaeota archaeon]|nr:hypothetical protein [Candidatus Woesearchaeota archaeon]|tara:strand:+ start:1271 stop:2356 length:1086 start_codon:yes stop_codon:yes gene_type:complete
MGAIKSTIVGTYPKPKYLMNGVNGRELLDSSGRVFLRIEKELGSEFKGLVDRACEGSIRDQEEAGIDIITDGEQRRDHYIHYVLRHLEGFDYDNMHEKPVKKLIAGKLTELYTMLVPRAVSSVTYAGEFLVDDFKFIQSRTTKEIKMCIPGPATVVDAVQNDFYSTDRVLAEAYATAINQEVRALRNAGCKIIQIEDPGLLRDLSRAEEWGIELLDRCFEGVEGLTTIAHVCCSYPNKRLEAEGITYKSDKTYYPDLFDLLQASAIDQVSIEAKQTNLSLEALKQLEGKSVILGCIDVGSETVETVGNIVAQAEDALKYVRPEQLILGPDCGMLLLSEQAAKAKLTNLEKAAETLNEMGPL